MKQIKDFPTYYVTNEGRVYSQRGNKLKLLKPRKSSRDYYQVSLRNANGMKQKLIHRLVAEAYHPNPLNKPYVCHKDDDTSNNHKDNVFWGTAKENQQDCMRKGRGNRTGPRKIANDFLHLQ